jgi:hypothetical protein
MIGARGDLIRRRSKASRHQSVEDRPTRVSSLFLYSGINERLLGNLSGKFGRLAGSRRAEHQTALKQNVWEPARLMRLDPQVLHNMSNLDEDQAGL